MPRLSKILVANRGEIACRVLRTVRAMGRAGVAVYSDADENAPHVTAADEAVRIGPSPSRESYLAIDRLLAAARAVGADAIHPGYGFLSENAEFAARCSEAGMVFIGPPVEAIRRMGSKIEAKAIMARAGVPVIPGVAAAGLAGDALAVAARKIGFPLLIKASAGGGGKGMRIVRDAGALVEAVAAARREAASAFGDDTLLLERYLDRPRHVEIQIFGDAHGGVVHCFERECSIQRRYQKIVEEAPSPGVTPALRARMGEAAVTAARAIGYVGAGTVEFVLDASGAFYFLEVNTRLQVEHPVTEMVTGLDLVRLQILVAEGAPLPFQQAELALDGHAIEARLYAEDPVADFLPATGRLALWEPAPLAGVRYDSGVVAGSEVGVHYDPLLAKIVAHGATRTEASERLVRALRGLGVGGITTNRDFLLAVLTHPAFAAGDLDTHFIERHLPPDGRGPVRDAPVGRRHALVAALAGHARRRRAAGPHPPSIPSGWRNNRWRRQDVSFRLGRDARAGAEEIGVRYVAHPGDRFTMEADGVEHAVRVFVAPAGEGGARPAPADRAGEPRDGVTRLDVEIDGVRRRYAVACAGALVIVHDGAATTELTELPRFPAAHREDVAGGCVAPMTGVIRDVRVAIGDRVEKGMVLLVLEAMKMEHQMIAHGPGVVREVRVEVGQMVDPDAVLIVVEAEETAPEPAA